MPVDQYLTLKLTFPPEPNYINCGLLSSRNLTESVLEFSPDSAAKPGTTSRTPGRKAVAVSNTQTTILVYFYSEAPEIKAPFAELSPLTGFVCWRVDIHAGCQLTSFKVCRLLPGRRRSPHGSLFVMGSLSFQWLVSSFSTWPLLLHSTQ